jgi:5'-nucleotidase
VSERRFAIKGTPTDCVIMGVRHILSGKAPDLVLSGVNRGSNTGEDVTYSGTIAGAMEGTILGIPSVALSQAYSPDTRLRPHWQTALHYAPDLIRKILDAGMPRDVLVNINFPDCLPGDVNGIAVTSQGRREQEWIRIEPRHDGRGIPYFWVAFTRGEQPSAMHGTDLSALADKRIAVTPLRVDMTDEPFMTRLAQVLE